MIGLDHDERAHQQFALALNRYVQTTLAEGSRRVCERRVVPALGALDLRDARDRQRLRQHMEAEPMHRWWLAMMQIWQDLLWRYTGECVDRQLDALVARCRPRTGDCGTLRLDPALPIPAYQAAVDNHSLPGGYHAETRPDDVRQGAIYALSSATYLLNQTGARHDYRGQTLMSHVLGRFPDCPVRDILDLGCLVGASTLAWAEQFPRARLCAVDTSAPALRFAHGMAEERGLVVHYSQQNAEQLDFADASFDLVVSHALLHETSNLAIRRIFAESFRVLRPGGVMAHIEVPARIEVMGPWEYLRSSYEGFYNQEPFWNGLTEADLVALAQKTGFVAAAQGFQKTAADGRAAPPPDAFLPLSAGKLDLSNWFVMSACKPAAGEEARNGR
jgi:ubiquinone/menaquinone biosynthesis C-methylase UbiE